MISDHNICLNEAGQPGKQPVPTSTKYSDFHRSACLQETASLVVFLLSPSKNPKSDILFMCKCGHCRYYHIYTHGLHSGWLHWPKQTWQQFLCCGAFGLQKRIYSPLSKGKACRHSNCSMTLTHASACTYALCTHTLLVLLAVDDSRTLEVCIWGNADVCVHSAAAPWLKRGAENRPLQCILISQIR